MTELLPGTLELLVLRTLSGADRHAYGIARRIEELSGGRFEVSGGSLFPALQRLVRAKALQRSWGVSETGRRARFYRLTDAGRSRLEQETRAWEEAVLAMRRVIEAT